MGLRDWKPKVPRFFTKETEHLERGLYRTNLKGDYSVPKDVKKIGTVWEPETIGLSYLRGEPPNLIGSKVEGLEEMPWMDKDESLHAPVIDFDIPIRVVESSTPGHYHLYIDTLVGKRDYQRILDALKGAGLVQRGFVQQLKNHGQTFVRWGTLKKDEKEN